MIALNTQDKQSEFNNYIDTPEFRHNIMGRRKFSETCKADKIHKAFESEDNKD